MATPSGALEISIANGFALMLETACSDFETLRKMVRAEVNLTAIDDFVAVRAAATVQMALAKSFIFHTVRAGRICEHGAGSLNVSREERQRFLASLGPVLRVRDVNEHGFDAKNGRSKPSMHLHDSESAVLDETSLVILGDTKILVGPLNLYELYERVARMRDIAGFASLRSHPG